MTCIRLYEHPMRADAQVFEAPSIGEWLLEHYGASPQGINVQVFAGEPSAETEITGDVPALLANDRPEYVVLQSPGGAETAAWIAIIQIILTVASVAIALLATPPTMPNNVNRTQTSPNNALGNRTNQLRLLQRVEDIYGTVLAIPSLMMPTYIKYIDNEKYEYGYYCISRGYISVAAMSDGDTLIADIAGASAAVYGPFESPNSGDAPLLQIGDPIIDTVLTVARSNQVDGITLMALNQLQLAPGALYTFDPDPAGDILRQATKAPNVNSIVEPGDEITITMTDNTVEFTSATCQVILGVFIAAGYGSEDWVDPFVALTAGDSVVVVGGTYSGTYTVISKTTTGELTVASPPADGDPASVSFSVARNYSGTYEVDGVADGFLVLTTSTWPYQFEKAATVAVVTVEPVTEYTDWVTLAEPDRTEIWVNVIALGGLYKDSGGLSEVTVDYEIAIEQLDPGDLTPTGYVELVTGSISGTVGTERAETVEHVTAWVGPARVRMRRTSDHDFAFAGVVIDEIKWGDLYTVTPVDKEDFGLKTTVHTITRATARSTAVKARELNCLASRLIPIYNGTSFSGAFNAEGRLVSGTISATSKIVNIIAAVSVDPKIGARNLATEVDMAQIWSVQQQLDAWNPACGQFNYTLDTDNMSFEETVMAVANAGFCIAYRQSGKIRLALDRPQSASVALFTHRNKKPNSDVITRKFANDADYDGVEFVYTDPDTAQSETITLPLDGSAVKAQKFEIPGIRSFTQAWYRASREYSKLLGQRITIETSTTMDARALLPNARVDIVDNTRFRAYDGEVVAQAGLMLTLSQDVEFMTEDPHSIVLMRRDGTLESVVVTAGALPNQVVLAYAPCEAIVTTAGPEGVRTIFSFGSDSARAAQAYLVQEIDLSDGQYPVVRAVNYSAAYYAADSLAVPDKAPIIN